MTSILDQFTRPDAEFLPHTAQDLFALRLAQKLNDAKAVRHYATLAVGHSESQLLNAYRRTIRNARDADLGRRFHWELERAHSNSHNGRAGGSLVAIRVERRTVAAAIFHRDHLEYTDSRQLSSDRDRALASSIGFVQWILARFPVEAATLESIVNGHEFQRKALHDGICEGLRDRILPLWEIPKTALLEGYGYPALKSRRQLREVATGIWPILEGTHAKVFIQDAAVLGLHVQTERHFIIN
jgi:hypothetical protein